MLAPDQMVDYMGAAGGASTVAEPLLASVTQHNTGWVVDVTVTTGVLRQLLTSNKLG